MIQKTTYLPLHFESLCAKYISLFTVDLNSSKEVEVIWNFAEQPAEETRQVSNFTLLSKLTLFIVSVTATRTFIYIQGMNLFTFQTLLDCTH